MTSLAFTLPTDIILEIFKFLSPEQLGQVSCVCKTWQKIGTSEVLWKKFDLKELFPKLAIIDEAVWEAHIDLKKYQLSFEDILPLDNRQVIPLIKRLFATLKIENDAGITFLTLPKGLSYNKAKEFAQSPLQGNSTNFRYTWHQSPEGLADAHVKKTHRVFITNQVIYGSRTMTFTEQKLLLSELKCQIPEVLPLSTLAILTYITSKEIPPTRLLSDNPTTYSRCSDTIDNYSMVCGGYSMLGLGIDSFSLNFNSYLCGASAYLKLNESN